MLTEIVCGTISLKNHLNKHRSEHLSCYLIYSFVHSTIKSEPEKDRLYDLPALFRIRGSTVVIVKWIRNFLVCSISVLNYRIFRLKLDYYSKNTLFISRHDIYGSFSPSRIFSQELIRDDLSIVFYCKFQQYHSPIMLLASQI